MEELWFRPLVWADYRLALLFMVILPIILLIWAFVRQIEAIQCLLTVYWRIASLLMVTLYLMIPAWGEDNTPFENFCGQMSFVTGFAARVLIPFGLWFWVDLNDEIKDLPQTLLKLALTSWRWAVTVYASLGAIASLPFLSCSFSAGAIITPFCQVWLEAPLGYQTFFHPHAKPGFLGFLGLLGLVFYVLYFVYFLIFRLGKQGRSALQQ